LPPVPKIDAVLEPHQTPQSVGTISSVVNKQVTVEATDHKLVLNEGSILWLTEQRIPLGIVDEVFGPVKKTILCCAL
jgi:H/ACA ribonucleoprotein complex non-core subunit NAF1